MARRGLLGSILEEPRLRVRAPARGRSEPRVDLALALTAPLLATPIARAARESRLVLRSVYVYRLYTWRNSTPLVWSDNPCSAAGSASGPDQD